jgi:hypothetical protein
MLWQTAKENPTSEPEFISGLKNEVKLKNKRSNLA